MERDEDNKVAIYWDFENIHASLANEAWGENWYGNNRFTAQPALIDVDPIVNYAASLGDISINRAYGNWQWFGKYSRKLNATGIDLIQMFPRGQNSKNSADIRMALDALSDIHVHGHINHVVIVSSDSDFISLAQKIKQAGKFVAAVGVLGYTNQFFVRTCNEFKFYHLLVGGAQPSGLASTAPASVSAGLPGDQEAPSPSQAPVGPLSQDQAKETLRQALALLVNRGGGAPIPKASLKHAIMRLQPSFDEKALGFSNFSDFITHFRDVVRVVDTVSGGHVEPK